MNVSQSVQTSFSKSLALVKMRKGVIYLLIFIFALVAFEAFNFSTTDFALSDLLGDVRFAGIRWATLLAIAFCGIDFAGIARLFMPQSEAEDSRVIWFMFGAWILAGTMNAILTWWGVVIAMQTHPIMSTGMVDATFVTKVVPIFIALMVWVIRILLVGTLTKKDDRSPMDFQSAEKPTMSRREFRQAQSRTAQAAQVARSVPAGFSSAPKPKGDSQKRGYRPEPQYIPMQDQAAFHSLRSSDAHRRRL